MPVNLEEVKRVVSEKERAKSVCILNRICDLVFLCVFYARLHDISSIVQGNASAHAFANVFMNSSGRQFKQFALLMAETPTASLVAFFRRQKFSIALTVMAIIGFIFTMIFIMGEYGIFVCRCSGFSRAANSKRDGTRWEPREEEDATKY